MTKSNSRSGSYNSVSLKSNISDLTKKSSSVSLNLWKLSFLLAVIAIILLIYVLASPGLLYEKLNSNVATAYYALSAIAWWLGIFVWIYRLASGLPVLKYWCIGLFLNVLIPLFIMAMASYA